MKYFGQDTASELGEVISNDFPNPQKSQIQFVTKIPNPLFSHVCRNLHAMSLLGSATLSLCTDQHVNLHTHSHIVGKHRGWAG